MIKIQERIYQLENELCVRRYDDLADNWYVFEDVLRFVFQINDPADWLLRAEKNPHFKTHLATHLVEFPIDNPVTNKVDYKSCITEYGLWLFLCAIPQYKVLSCSQSINRKIPEKHNKIGIDSVRFFRQLERLGTKGEFSPATVKALQYQMMSEPAKIQLRAKKKYEAMSKIDQWLYDVTKYLTAQARAETKSSEDVLVAVQKVKKQMLEFEQIIKYDLGLNF